MEHKLTTPCTAQDLEKLRAGDTVLLTGVVYTARDAAHKRMCEALDAGETLPFDLEGSAIYYVGPTPEKPGKIIGSAGPTTSGRMDAYSPRLLDLGNKLMIGKGKRDAAVKEAVDQSGRTQVLVFGTETHICVLQTALGLLFFTLFTGQYRAARSPCARIRHSVCASGCFACRCA